MKMPKPTEADKQYFTELVAKHPEVELKPMFGNLGAFVNGNMVAGLFGSVVGLRVNEVDRAALEAEPGSGPFGPRSDR
jgi:TfoX/Sxy family transcriptional regulator of competence genes